VKTERTEDMKKIDKGTYAVVTGASSGIGWAIALELASKGVNLILVARRKERLEQLKEIIVKNNKVEVLIIDTDLADLENCKRLVEKTKELEPQIIVNNAGFGQYGFFTELDLDKELAMIRLNIESLHVLTKLYLTSMKKGVIMNVASMAGFIPTPLLASYAATKAYVLNFSRAIDYELKKQKSNIRVISLCPGPVISEFGIVANTKQGKYALSSEACAKTAVKGILKRKQVTVPGFIMKLSRIFIKILPTSWVLPVVINIQKHK